MIRDVDLVSYLPPFMAEYQEIRATLEAENPEFVLVWKAADRVLSNEFIATADEYGISRFEKILGIFPSREDTLESRRSRVQARWFNKTPYTWRVFIERLISLCGENNFTITTDFLHYRIDLEVNFELFGQVEELEHLIDTLVPCNMVFTSSNKFQCRAEGMAFAAGGIVFIRSFFITNDGKATYTIQGDAFTGGGVIDTSYFFITPDSKENVISESKVFPGGGVMNTARVFLTNDFNESFNINGTAFSGSGAISTDFIEIKTSE